MKQRLKKQAFTLIEILIASSILMMIVGLAVTIFYNVTKVNAYLEYSSLVQFEANNTLNKIARQIETNTIDYSEYYNYYAINNGGLEFNINDDTYGSNHSTYATRFLDPGNVANAPTQQGVNYGGLSTGGDDLGTYCYVPSTATYELSTSEECDGLPSLEYTADVITGTNPYETNTSLPIDQASSVCDTTTEMSALTSANRRSTCSSISNIDEHTVDTLFLISPDGFTKTMIAREPWVEGDESGNVVSMLKMDGYDNDNNSVPELFVCSDGFVCCETDGSGNATCANSIVPNFGVATGTSYVPYSDDIVSQISMSNLDDLEFNFAPISPPEINITDLRFYIAPIEDPYKAFDEEPQQIHPYVTIVMTATVNDSRADLLPESLKTVTKSITVTPRFQGEINSYLVQ